VNKPDTKMRACKRGCGRRYWCEKAGTCPECKAVLAEIAADNKRLRASQTQSRNAGSLPAAVARGRQMCRAVRVR
jgi:hypothetical protein